MEKNYVVSGYNPPHLFRHFEDLCAIPHGSRKEHGLAEHLAAFARERGLWYMVDEYQNVVIKKPASPSFEHRPSVALQAHLDMVCVKSPDSDHNFDTDPLKLRLVDGWLKATDTTLGGDNGTGVAVMMTLLEDPDLEHPALECIFTSREEIGLEGAVRFDAAPIEARTLINLDSDMEGMATVGCAGGARVDLSRALTFGPHAGPGLRLAVSGLIGGHSGIDIDKSRGSASKLMGRILLAVAEGVPMRIADLSGGDMDNAIPALCTCVVALDSAEDLEKAKEAAQTVADQIREELRWTDPGFTLTLEEAAPQSAMSEADTQALVSLLTFVPNGPQIVDPAENFVISSSNLGILEIKENKFRAGFCIRSSLSKGLDALSATLRRLGSVLGFEYGYHLPYPGWTYDPASPIKALAGRVYRALFGKDLTCRPLHAGMECGVFCEKLPGLDAIVLAPTLEFVHSPEERLDLASYERHYAMVRALVTALAKEV